MLSLTFFTSLRATVARFWPLSSENFVAVMTPYTNAYVYKELYPASRTAQGGIALPKDLSKPSGSRWAYMEFAGLRRRK